MIEIKERSKLRKCVSAETSNFSPSSLESNPAVAALPMPTPGVAGRTAPPRPPERGSFPLDRLGECRKFAKAYRKCIRAQDGHLTSECRRISKLYLECRMER